MPYRFLEDIATADIAFEARGETLEEVFTAVAEATMNVMIESFDSIGLANFGNSIWRVRSLTCCSLIFSRSLSFSKIPRDYS